MGKRTDSVVVQQRMLLPNEKHEAAGLAVPAQAQSEVLAEIERADRAVTEKYTVKLETNYDLDRRLVSFQANKDQTGHRWCKYKEGFSAPLIRYIIEKTAINSGTVLDPFAGSGTALFVAGDNGLDSLGIELLPSSAEIIEVRKVLLKSNPTKMANALRDFVDSRVWEREGKSELFPHLRITNGAFPKDNERLLCRYLAETDRIKEPDLRRVLRFAAMCVLESVSYTRKDGQYLRWDYRSGRCSGKKRFDKGRILGFSEAVRAKLLEIVHDISRDGQLFPTGWAASGRMELRVGSCLDILPELAARSFTGIVTSPPYCNRYDYTRTYAIELAMLGQGEEAVRALRQEMLSCTVENKEKECLHRKSNPTLFKRAMGAFESHELLSCILRYLDHCKDTGEINNNGIPRMVRNYFRELALVVFECHRLLKRGAPMVMVNDNVRYQGVVVPVDLILSDIAQEAGFEVETIWVLPVGKGNSSQQMGKHGRQEIRKCVYVWRAK